MKFLLALLVSVACASVSSAQDTNAPATNETPQPKLPRIVIPPDKPAKAAPGTTKPGTASKTNADAKATSAKDAKDAKDAKAAKIEGVEVSRGAKGFLGVQIVDSTFKISFYDEKKKPVALDVDRAALRWDPKYKVGEERVVLVPGSDGKSLSSPKNIRPPYQFKLFVTLIKDAAVDAEPVNETYTLDFKQ